MTSEQDNQTHARPETADSDTQAGQMSGFSAAMSLLVPGWTPTQDGASQISHRVVFWIVALGLLTGLLWIGAFRLSWRIYGETVGLRVMPALVVVLLECVLTGPYLVLGLARTASRLLGRSGVSLNPTACENAGDSPLSPVGTLALCLTVLAQYILILSIPYVTPWWPGPSDWRQSFAFLYPAPLYRPLLLAPLWGRWGILLAASIGRTASGADGLAVGLCRAMNPSRLLCHTVLPCILTAIYFSRDQNILIGVVMSMLVFGMAYVPAVFMARRGGGQTRLTLLATAQIAQLAFLAVYRAFWPLIHG